MEHAIRLNPADRELKSNSRKTSRLPVWSLALFLVSSCRTASVMPPADLSEPGWVISHGQAVWRSSREAPGIAGELLMATNSTGRTVVEFTKTPLPILVAQTTSNEWRVELVVENRVFSGPMPAPVRATWIHLAACVEGRAPPKGLVFSRLDDTRWHLENIRSGESIEGYLGSDPQAR